jgi:hypothetical protein
MTQNVTVYNPFSSYSIFGNINRTESNEQYSFNILFKPVLRSRIIFMWLRLRVKILMRLWLLPYCIERQNFFNELKFKHMLKLSCSYDYV